MMWFFLTCHTPEGQSNDRNDLFVVPDVEKPLRSRDDATNDELVSAGVTKEELLLFVVVVSMFACFQFQSLGSSVPVVPDQYQIYYSRRTSEL